MKFPEHLRLAIKHPVYGQQKIGDKFGIFSVISPFVTNYVLCIIADSGEYDGDWCHVSVHASNLLGIQRTPIWEEMCYVKDLFFDADELCVQYHPPKSIYVNQHQYTLHMWHLPNTNFPMPPIERV